MRDVDDPRLGQLTWATDLQMLEGHIESPDGAVEIGIEVADDSLLATQLAHALRIARIVADLEKQAKQVVVDDMLDMKNTGWLSDGEPSLGAEEFKNRIRLGRIDVLDGGDATLIFHDDDIFWGHYITVGLRVDGTFTCKGIVG